jgi:ankyrin repeat protein
MGNDISIIPSPPNNSEAPPIPDDALTTSMFEAVLSAADIKSINLSNLNINNTLTATMGESPDMNLPSSEHYFRNHPHTLLHELARTPNSAQKIQYLIKNHKANINAGLVPYPTTSTTAASSHSLEDQDSDYDDDSEAEMDEDEDAFMKKRLTPFWVAVNSNRVDNARTFYQLGAPFNTRISCEYPSPLFLAVEKDRLDMTRFLLSCGSNPNVPDSVNGDRPLKRVKSPELALLLIAAGANVNARSSMGWSNLHFTPVRGSEELALALIANGENPRAVDGDAKTTPAGAAMCCCPELLSLLERYYARLVERGFFAHLSIPAAPSPKHLSERHVRNIEQLEGQLRSYVLDDEKTTRKLEEIYATSIHRLAAERLDTRMSVTVFCGNKVPQELVRVISSFLEDGLICKFDGWFDVRCDEFVGGDEYYYGDVEAGEDACSDNEFAGGGAWKEVDYDSDEGSSP